MVERYGKKNLVDHPYTLLAFLSAGTAELEVEDKDLGADESARFYWFTLSDVVPMKKSIKQISWRCAKSAHQNAERNNFIFFEAAVTGC